MKIIKRFGAFVLILIMAFLLYYSNRVISEFLNSPYFEVKSVNLIGVLNADISRMDSVSKKMLGKNIFKINENDYSPFFNDEWIEKVEIIKNYPSKIKLVVYEKKPLFNFNKGGVIYSYLSDDSYLKAKNQESKIIVYGNYWKENLKKFKSFYDNNYLSKMEKIELMDSYIKMTDGEIIIKAGYDGGSFVKSAERLNNILKRYKKVNYVDLRIKNRIYVDGVRL
jgi:cell division septal protein FtsQ